MKKILLIFILIIFSNCQDQKIENNFNPQENQVLTVEEDFNAFFEKFKKDSVFQKQRVVFPLKVRVFNIDNLKTEENSLEEENYELLRIDENEVSMEKKISKDSVKIILKGKDNGIYIETQFLKDKGIWKLESYNDQST
jgi:hypothetical protein